YLKTYQFSGKRSLTIGATLRAPPLNNDIFPLDIAEVAKTLPELLYAGRGNGATSQEPYPGYFRRPLRLGGRAKSQEHRAKRKDCDFFHVFSRPLPTLT